jgi:type I restriction enzyme, R subunit
MSAFNENTVEQAALEWLAGIGYSLAAGPEIGFGAPGAERADPGYRDVLLAGRLQEALRRPDRRMTAKARPAVFQEEGRCQSGCGL